VLGGCFLQEPNWACSGPERHVWKSGDDGDSRWRSAVSSALKLWGALCLDADGREVWIGTRVPPDRRAVAVTIGPAEGPDNDVLLSVEAACDLLKMLSQALSALEAQQKD